MATHTAGPWTVTEQESWPFDIEILHGGGAIVRMTRAAYSTEQKSLSDVMAGVGFAWAERDDVVEALATQMADARLIAAAPDLLALAHQYRDDLRHPPTADSITRRLAAIDAVLAKVTGDA